MNIIGIIGTVFGTKTKIALEHIKFNDDVNYELIDLSNYKLPFADGRAFNEYNEDTITLVNKIMDADAIIIGSPVYQASIPGSLKNLFDLFPIDAIRDKPVGIIISSGSDKHYLVAQYSLIPILNYLKADVLNKYIYITQENYFGNVIKNDDIDMRMEQLANELVNRAILYKDKLKMFDF